MFAKEHAMRGINDRRQERRLRHIRKNRIVRKAHDACADWPVLIEDMHREDVPTGPVGCVRVNTCADSETIAALLDGRLRKSTRCHAIAHLADCCECRDLIVAAAELRVVAERNSGASCSSLRLLR